MLNIAITAGGTTENIDGVRKITNVSTGTLGVFMLKSILQYIEKHRIKDYTIYYISTKTAKKIKVARKYASNVKNIKVDNCQSVYNVVDRLTKYIKIDLFIHSMAISDFTYAYSVTVSELAQEIIDLAKTESLDFNNIIKILNKPNSKIDNDKKISSTDDILMGLRRTSKVISLIKKNNPNTFLVGFKLLRNVEQQELIKAAWKLYERDGCNLVLANLLDKIDTNNHKGYLIYKSFVIDEAEGKKNIADMIIKHSLEKIL